jgi:hypothetical protein
MSAYLVMNRELSRTAPRHPTSPTCALFLLTVNPQLQKFSTGIPQNHSDETWVLLLK